MDRSRAALAGFLMLSVALAGCTGGDEAGISVKAPGDPVTEPYVFSAKGGGDRFVWNFGDGSPAVEGKSVEHVYGFANGELTVELRVEKGETPQTFTKKLTLGTGQNAAPEFQFEAATNWAVVGESVAFSAARSADPDGDPLRYQWICFYKGELLASHGGHAHGGEAPAGVPFGSGSAARQPFTVAEASLPEPTRTADGEFCDTFNGGTFGMDHTVAGTFGKAGAYSITLVGRDPVNPSVAGEFTLFVTETRPDAVFTESFSGSLQGGSGGQFQSTADTLGLGESSDPFDQVSHSFSLELPATALYVNLTYDAAAAMPGDAVTYTVYRDNKAVFVDQTGSNVYLNQTAGTYRMTLTVHNAASVSYTLDIAAPLDMKPTHKYEAP